MSDEEQRFWDAAAASCEILIPPGVTVDAECAAILVANVAAYADALLAERRKRYEQKNADYSHGKDEV